MRVPYERFCRAWSPSCTVTPGEQVTAGANLITLEAMKMEHTVRAPYAAKVKNTPYEQGATVQEGDLLIELVASSETPAE